MPPIYDQAVIVAEDVLGETSGWSEIEFSEPIASASEALYVIFQLPANVEMSREGLDGGPGFGYQNTDGGPCVFVSPDGDEWVRLHMQCRVLAEALNVARESGMLVLSEPIVEEPPIETIEEWSTSLGTPYPNPFNPSTNLRFTLREQSHVSIMIYNVRGELVAKLFNDIASAGPHVVSWSGENQQGRPVPSGVYFAKFLAGPVEQTQRLILIR